LQTEQRIFVQTQGGLGNQLFQFNFAHEVALKFPNVTVYLIDGAVQGDREYSLQKFLNSCTHLSENWRSGWIGKQHVRLLYGFKRRRPNWLENKYTITTPLTPFDDSSYLDRLIYNSKSRNIYIRGDYINKSIPISSCLIKEFERFESQNVDAENNRFEIVIHIRRGDYLMHSNYGPLGLEYYEKILLNLPSSHKVLIHTDDASYVAENLKVRQYTKILGAEHSPLELIKDASFAHFFIGSNSTLSWWAATNLELNGESSHPIIIMPKLWFRNQIKTNYELLSHSWSLEEPIWA
jgi:hypothetical protein